MTLPASVVALPLPENFPVLPPTLVDQLRREGALFEMHSDGPAVVFISTSESRRKFQLELVRAATYMEILDPYKVSVLLRLKK